MFTWNGRSVETFCIGCCQVGGDIGKMCCVRCESVVVLIHATPSQGGSLAVKMKIDELLNNPEELKKVREKYKSFSKNLSMNFDAEISIDISDVQPVEKRSSLI